MFDQLKNFMDVQKKLKEVKEQLGRTTFSVASADGLVTITMNGSQEIQALELGSRPQEIDKARLEAALKDAMSRAVKRSQEVAAQKMREVTGIKLPGQD
ncbi:MAG: YbaB/EbfC family nucleoid-associated protein [Candidatus Omnitrophica bacterium]|nr:YbaB/EbfC family nucleoid-associated protein [Candidatus Omnitrophota bacterium]